MTCDSALVGLIEYDGKALSIGRRSQRATDLEYVTWALFFQ